MTDDAIKHGTYSGYQQHTHRRVPVEDGDPCGCRAAAAEYQRKYRAEHVGQASAQLAKDRAVRKAKMRAYRELANKHPEEFRILMGRNLRRVLGK